MKIILTENEFKTYIKTLLNEFRPFIIKPFEDSSKRTTGLGFSILQGITQENALQSKKLDSLLIDFEKQPLYSNAVKIIECLHALNFKGTLKRRYIKQRFGAEINDDPQSYMDETLRYYHKLYKVKMDYIEKFLQALHRHPNVGIVPVIADDENNQRCLYFIRKEDYDKTKDGKYFNSVKIGKIPEKDGGPGALHSPIDVAELNQYGILIPRKLIPMVNFDNENCVYDPQAMNYINQSIVKSEAKKAQRLEKIKQYNEMFKDCTVNDIKGCHNAKGEQCGAILIDNKTDRATLVKSSEERIPLKEPIVWYDGYDDENNAFYNYVDDNLYFYKIKIKNSQPSISKTPSMIDENILHRFYF